MLEGDADEIEFGQGGVGFQAGQGQPLLAQEVRRFEAEDFAAADLDFVELHFTGA